MPRAPTLPLLPNCASYSLSFPSSAVARRVNVAGLYLLRPPRVATTYEYPRAKMWPAHAAVHRRIPLSGEPRQQAQRVFAIDRGALGVFERIGAKPVRRLDGFAIGIVRAEQKLRDRYELHQRRELAGLIALGDLIVIFPHDRLRPVGHARILPDHLLADESADQERQRAARVRPDERDGGDMECGA